MEPTAAPDAGEAGAGDHRAAAQEQGAADGASEAAEAGARSECRDQQQLQRNLRVGVGDSVRLGLRGGVGFFFVGWPNMVTGGFGWEESSLLGGVSCFEGRERERERERGGNLLLLGDQLPPDHPAGRRCRHRLRRRGNPAAVDGGADGIRAGGPGAAAAGDGEDGPAGGRAGQLSSGDGGQLSSGASFR